MIPLLFNIELCPARQDAELCLGRRDAWATPLLEGPLDADPLWTVVRPSRAQTSPLFSTENFPPPFLPFNSATGRTKHCLELPIIILQPFPHLLQAQRTCQAEVLLHMAALDRVD